MDYTELLDRIIDLSYRDTKTLSQKGLKAAEEVGELGKAILPFEGAHGTNHRPPVEDKVIEECADIILVAFSIMASMGKSVEEIAQVISRKTDYWEFLVDNEDKADLESLDFEVHITVEEAVDVERFSEDCKELGVKPIILDLYAGKTTIKDVMTSSHFRGNTRDAMTYAKRLAEGLREMGYRVLREKIETVPWHPAALVNASKASAYFEAHVAFLPDERLADFARLHNIHLSRNTMKKNGDVVTMGTYRVDASETNSRAFGNAVENICKHAELVGLKIKSKPHTEYSLWDTNEKHDGEWLRDGVN